MSDRIITFMEALREAQASCLREDPSVYLMGLGVPGPTGIFGTTKGLVDEFGDERVRDMPSSEGGMTGVALGTAINGMRPVMVHMRVDFAVLSMETIVNQAAKWHYMYGGKMTAPMAFRMIIGRGWGQGPQHSQSLQAWFAHIPGLKVVMPSTPRDAKGMLIAAIEDDAPVVVVEHRWLYGIKGHVPEEHYSESLEGSRVMREGKDVTLAGLSYMTLECLRAAEMLETIGIDAEVLDLRSLTPIDGPGIARSVKKTGHFVVADTANSTFGAAAEASAIAVEYAFDSLKKAPARIGLPWTPTPTSPSLADKFYPRAIDIAREAARMLGGDVDRLEDTPMVTPWHDVPDPTYTGPY